MSMALRPIDNALPMAQERPKKQAKVSAPVSKQQELVANDENKAPAPENVEATIDYVASESLKPVEDPDSKIQSLIEELDSKDWVKLCASLNDTRRFALFNSDLLAPLLEKVVVVMVKAMKNPRSALIKTSIMCSSDVFSAFGDKLLDLPAPEAFDQLLLQLLLKASQDKKFVCEEADRALSTMVGSFVPSGLLHRLRVYVKHTNLRVRAKAAVSISNCVSKMVLEGMKDFGLVSLVQMAADLVTDRLPEAREAARSVLVAVYSAFTAEEEQKHEAWQEFCHANLSPLQIQSVVKFTTSS